MAAVMLRMDKKTQEILALFLDRPAGDEKKCWAYHVEHNKEILVDLPVVMRTTKCLPLWPIGIDIFNRMRAVGYTDMTAYYRTSPDMTAQRKLSPTT